MSYFGQAGPIKIFFSRAGIPIAPKNSPEKQPMLMQALSNICFPEGPTAIAQHIRTPLKLKATLRQMGLGSPRPVIALVGGASGLRHYHIARLHAFFVKILAPLAEASGAVVVDGGTDCGIMRMIGNARHQTHSTFPLLGVVPAGVVTLPGELSSCPDAAPLEPNHTHFLLIPGDQWGDECKWLAESANALAQEAPSITVLVNGGEITWRDAAESVQAGRPIVAIAGSGRTADLLVSALHGDVADPRASEIVASGLLHAAELNDLEQLEISIKQFLNCS